MPDDDFQIEVGETVRRHILRKPSPLGDSSKAVVPYDSPDTDPIPVFVSEQVMQQIERHALSDKENEVGGVLLGAFYRNDKGSFVEITDCIEAASAKGTDVSLTFTHETWESIHAKIAQLNDDSLKIVGWYHSHPGLGVFLSKDDEFIHTSYFSDPWNVAIVHDPVYTNWGCFKWADGELERTGGFYIFGEKKHAKQLRNYVKKEIATRQAPPRSASAGADRLAGQASASVTALWAAVIALLLIQILTASFMIWKLYRGPQIDEYKIAIQMLQHSNMSGAQEHLRRELAAHPENSQAYRRLLKLDDVMSSPAVAAFKNDDFDRQNMILASGDELALKHSEPVDDSPVSDDPLNTVIGAYEKAAATRADRISRARAVSAAAKAQSPDADTAPKWSLDAVKWLVGEDMRQFAYLKQSDPTKYLARYTKLPKDKKDVVDAVFGSKK